MTETLAGRELPVAGRRFRCLMGRTAGARCASAASSAGLCCGVSACSAHMRSIAHEWSVLRPHTAGGGCVGLDPSCVSLLAANSTSGCTLMP